ncbi:MAG: FAD-dependent oxidoreductase, partial [Mycobacterium leprae]
MQAHPFGPQGRKAALAQMAAGELDLLIVGGGITGCGLARDATLRGLRVALVEKADFGYGTSSRSSKLVHGGLRYMSQGDIALVQESIRERRVLQAIAPHLVHPLAFIYPIHAEQSALPLRLGFPIFDRMAGNRGEERHQRLTPEQVRERIPGLRPDLLMGFAYGEFITDDSRFTLENALSAALHGALVANHARVTRFTLVGGQVTGAEVVDELDGTPYTVVARVVVNATGPWVRETVALGAQPVPLTILPSKGIHLLFRAERLPVAGAVVLNAPSGKHGFAIRRWQYVYVGTTDVTFAGSLEQPQADEAAVSHLLSLVQECFPDLHLCAADVVATWAGLRPLVAPAGR